MAFFVCMCVAKDTWRHVYFVYLLLLRRDTWPKFSRIPSYRHHVVTLWHFLFTQTYRNGLGSLFWVTNWCFSITFSIFMVELMYFSFVWPLRANSDFYTSLYLLANIKFKKMNMNHIFSLLFPYWNLEKGNKILIHMKKNKKLK